MEFKKLGDEVWFDSTNGKDGEAIARADESQGERLNCGRVRRRVSRVDRRDLRVVICVASSVGLAVVEFQFEMSAL